MGTALWGVFLKIFLKIKKSPLDSLNREEKMIEELLSIKVPCRSRAIANQLPNFENLLILGSKT